MTEEWVTLENVELDDIPGMTSTLATGMGDFVWACLVG
ncbi:rCG36222 [Rattus norvegicus]|uniref:RCG36222 n=1 Tax=Rattus norvegicus TaxID=10116 RepID=A6IPX9_RAT|nr:rCG36222 [Rattus norvegicus]